MEAALETLAKAFGIKTLLLEGGGKINGTFLKAGLIDEVSVLIYPGIDGLAGVPCIFEYVGKSDEKPAEGQSLRHLTTATLDGAPFGYGTRLKNRSCPVFPAPKGRNKLAQGNALGTGQKGVQAL